MVFYNLINVTIVLSSLILAVSAHKTNSNNSQHGDSDLLKRLQELERKQGLSDRNAARLEHIIKTQADIIKEQKNKLTHLESFIQKQAARTAHVFHIARETRHRTFLITKVLARNNLTDERHVLGNHRGHPNQKGQGPRFPHHAAKDGHHGKNSDGRPRQNPKRPMLSLENNNKNNNHHQHHNSNKERQRDKNSNNRNHQKQNRPVISHNTNNHHLHQSQVGSPSEGKTHVNSESPTRHQLHQQSGKNGRDTSLENTQS